jgi:hypothetical protein
MGGTASKASTAAGTARRTLPRGAKTPIEPYSSPKNFVESVPETTPQSVKDLKLNEMMSKLTVDTAEVSAVDFGYAGSPSSKVKVKDRPPREGLLKPLELQDALEAHRASGFAASTVADFKRRHPLVDERVLKNALKHMRSYAYEEQEVAHRPGEKVRVGRW